LDDEPGPDSPPPPFPPPPFPPPPFNLETGEREDDFAAGYGEAEMHRHRRPRWSRYQGSVQGAEGENGFVPDRAEMDTRRRTGRWIRRNGRLIVLGV
jgi:hypothetical protein